MNLEFGFFGGGIRLKSRKGSFSISYPRGAWRGFSGGEKEFFLDNIAYLNTICTPLVSGLRGISYNTPRPFFKEDFDYSIIKDIPSAVEEYRTTTEGVMRKFRNTKYRFAGGKPKNPVFNAETRNRAVIPFSCGKDSLLTLAVCSELGLNPFPVYINDTVSPSENRLKLNFIRKISKEKKIDFAVIRNEIENLNDFEFWGRPEADVGYSHMVASFCFLSLPLVKFCNAKYIILGNELDLNDTLVNKDGVKCYPSYDQSFEGTKRMGRMISKATENKVGVTSVISPLYDLAVMRVLHTRFPGFGKYQSSCPGLDDSNEKRWCCKCHDCVRFFVYMHAVGANPKSIGIKRDLFDRKFRKHHSIFTREKKGRYEKASGDEQIKFAYYLAYKNGAKGYLIDLFKKKFLDEIKEKEDKLHKKYFSIHSTELIPREIRSEAVSIYKEGLGRF